MDAGTIAEWTTAAVTAAAVGVAVIAGRYARDAYILERERERSRQASCVSAWLSKRNDDERWGLMISNDSANAIYDVNATIHWDEDDSDTVHISIILPGLCFVPKPGANQFAVQVMDTSEYQPILHAKKQSASIGFRDASGLHWLRERFGELEHVS